MKKKFIKKNVKNLITRLTGGTVEALKTSYNLRGFSRTFRIYNMPYSEIGALEVLQELKSYLVRGYLDTVTIEKKKDFYEVRIKVAANDTCIPDPDTLTWTVYENDITESCTNWVSLKPIKPFEKPCPEVENAEVEAEPEKVSPLESLIESLHVGLNITPIGIFYAEDSQDLEKLREFLRAVHIASQTFHSIFS